MAKFGLLSVRCLLLLATVLLLSRTPVYADGSGAAISVDEEKVPVTSDEGEVTVTSEKGEVAGEVGEVAVTSEEGKAAVTSEKEEAAASTETDEGRVPSVAIDEGVPVVTSDETAEAKKLEEPANVAEIEECDNVNVEPEDPKCPSRPHVIRCAGKFLDLNKNNALERAELQLAIDKLPWYSRGLLKILGSIDAMMKKCDADKDGVISVDYDMEATKDQCLATCFKRRAFKSAFFPDCDE